MINFDQSKQHKFVKERIISSFLDVIQTNDSVESVLGKTANRTIRGSDGQEAVIFLDDASADPFRRVVRIDAFSLVRGAHIGMSVARDDDAHNLPLGAPQVRPRRPASRRGAGRVEGHRAVSSRNGRAVGFAVDASSGSTE